MLKGLGRKFRPILAGRERAVQFRGALAKLPGAFGINTADESSAEAAVEFHARPEHAIEITREGIERKAPAIALVLRQADEEPDRCFALGLDQLQGAAIGRRRFEVRARSDSG